MTFVGSAINTIEKPVLYRYGVETPENGNTGFLYLGQNLIIVAGEVARFSTSDHDKFDDISIGIYGMTVNGELIVPPQVVMGKILGMAYMVAEKS